MELYGFRVGHIINDEEKEECGFTNASGYADAMVNILYAYEIAHIYKIEINKINYDSRVVFVDNEDYAKIKNENIY